MSDSSAIHAGRPRLALLAAALLVAVLLASCGGPASTVFISAAPTDAIVPYLTGSNYAGSASVVGLRGKDGTEAWQTSIGERDNDGTTAVVGGVLYVEAGPTSTTPSAQAPSGGAILALRLRDGVILWRTPLPQLDYRVGVAADGTSVIAAAGKGGLYALDPSDGAIRWHVATPIDGPPHLAGDVVIMNLAGDPSNDQTTSTFGLAAYRESDGAPLWQKSFGSSIATNQLAAYATLGDDSFALANQTGRQLWDYPSGRTVEGGGADNYHGELIAVGAQLVLVQMAFPVVSNDLPTRDYVAALDAETGKVIWKASPGFDGTLAFGGPIFAVPSDPQTMIYGASGHQVIVLHSADGTKAWTTDVSPYTLQQAAYADGVLFALLEPPPCELGPCSGPTNQRMEALNAATGTSYWQRDVPDATVLAGAG